jgi:hypothetical protein
LFYVLEQLHTLPSVSYLARVRNSPTAGDNTNEETEAGQHEIPAAHEPAAH